MMLCLNAQAADDAAPSQQLLPSGQRVSPQQLAAMLSVPAATAPAAAPPSPLLLLDVRPAEQFDMCRLPGARRFTDNVDNCLTRQGTFTGKPILIT
jgi:hypothetical protein